MEQGVLLDCTGFFLFDFIGLVFASAKALCKAGGTVGFSNAAAASRNLLRNLVPYIKSSEGGGAVGVGPWTPFTFRKQV